MSTKGDVFPLVERLWMSPHNEEDRLVLADWCAEHGLEEAAAVLRKDKRDRFWRRARKSYQTEQTLIKDVLRSLWRLLRPLKVFPVSRREYVLGFPTSVIPAGGVQSIYTIPPLPFRPRRLVIPSDIAPSLVVEDLRVHGEGIHHLIPGPTTARSFSELGYGVTLDVDDDVEPKDRVVIDVTNHSGEAVAFHAGIVGGIVETAT